MIRWNISTHSNGEKPKVDAFIEELIEVSKRHGLSLAHEDNHGAFIVEKFSEANAQWLMDAHEDTK